MWDSDRTRQELLGELRRVRGHLEELEKKRATKELRAAQERDEPGWVATRRQLLKAAWTSPIVLSLALPRGAAGQAGPTTAPSVAPTRSPTTVLNTYAPSVSSTRSPTTVLNTYAPTVPATSSPTTVLNTYAPSPTPTRAPTATPGVGIIPLLNPDR